MIIGIIGKMRSGKDTISDMIIKNNQSFVKKQFAGKLKECVSLILNIPREDLEKEEIKQKILEIYWNDEINTVRDFLQQFGTLACRDTISENFWINALFSDYKTIPYALGESVKPDWVISDCRFKNEADEIKRRGGILINIYRYMSFKEWCTTFNLNIKTELLFNNDVEITQIAFYTKLAVLEFDNKLAFFNKINHISETDLDEYNNIDFHIHNYTLDDTFNQINDIMNLKNR